MYHANDLFCNTSLITHPVCEPVPIPVRCREALIDLMNQEDDERLKPARGVGRKSAIRKVVRREQRDNRAAKVVVPKPGEVFVQFEGDDYPKMYPMTLSHIEALCEMGAFRQPVVLAYDNEFRTFSPQLH